MGKSSQKKGANGEKELVTVLEGYGFEVQRGGSQTYGSIPDLVGLKSIHIEVKRTERLRIYEAMSQAIKDALRFRDGAPTIFFRSNHAEWLVIMRLPDWVRLYKRWVIKDDNLGDAKESQS